MRSILSLFAAALVTVEAVRPAAAQSPTSLSRPGVYAVTTNDPRVVAEYRFAEPYRRGMPTIVTVSDSAGLLVANFRVAGDRRPRPMIVSADGSDLLLQGESPVGILTLQLFQQNEPGNSPTVGRWRLAGYQGALRVRNVR